MKEKRQLIGVPLPTWYLDVSWILGLIAIVSFSLGYAEAMPYWLRLALGVPWLIGMMCVEHWTRPLEWLVLAYEHLVRRRAREHDQDTDVTMS